MWSVDSASSSVSSTASSRLSLGRIPKCILLLNAALNGCQQVWGQQVMAPLPGEKVSENVHSVSSKDFPSIVKTFGKAGFFVKFTVPWSGQCQAWREPYGKAAALINKRPQLQKLEYSIPFFTVDMTSGENRELGLKYEIRGFPTLIFFENHNDQVDPDATTDSDGLMQEEYEGDMEVDAVLDFLESVSGPALQESPPSDTERLGVTLYSAQTVPEFVSVARKHRRDAHWHHQTIGDSEKRLELRHFHEPVRTLKLDGLSGSALESKILQFWTDNKKPWLSTVSRETFPEFVDSPLLWILPQHDSEGYSRAVDDFRELAYEVAKRQKEYGLSPQFAVASTNTVNFRSPLQQMFGVTEFPRLIAQNSCGSQENWIWGAEDGATEQDLDLTNLLQGIKANGKEKIAGSVLAWLKKVQDGNLPRTFRSEPVPDYEVEAGEPQIVVAKNMMEKIFQKDRDVFLNVYAPWCGHCKNFAPDVRKLARKIHLSGLENKILIAQFDGTANESRHPEIQTNAFPSIYFVRAGTDSVLQYEGPRAAPALYKWISEQSSFRGQMDEEIGDIKLDL